MMIYSATSLPPEVEMRLGINDCESLFGPEVLMAVDPMTVCMIDGPGTDVCLVGRCFEVVNARIAEDGPFRQDPNAIASIDFYVAGSDERTEVCRNMLEEYQRRHRTRS